MTIPRLIPACLAACLAAAARSADPIHVCATVPDLGDLVRRVGGDAVDVTVFVRGTEDPEVLDPRPGFAKALARADLVVSVGVDLEANWLPAVVAQSQNPRLAKGQPGWLEAVAAVAVLGQPPATPEAGAPAGHVHAAGNPHFLSDPVCGVQVAVLIARRLGELVPARAAAFAANEHALAAEVARRLLGEAVVKRAGEAAVTALEAGDPAPVIGDGADLGGWLGLMRPHAGVKVVADHDLWAYAARRFGFVPIAFMEPEPGEPPTTRHLADVVAVAQGAPARLIVTNPAFDQRHTRFVADKTGLPVVVLAHQAGALPDASDWLATIDRNVRALVAALDKGK